MSQRLRQLANDNESWKERYYARWVRPRVLQIPSTTPRSTRDIPRYSAKSANWLDQRHLTFPQKTTDWKWQYRIRTNWHRGTCNVQALDVSQPPAACAIIKIHDGIVFEAASTGLQAWANTKTSTPLATELFVPDDDHRPFPTAMAIDASGDILRIGIGFSDSSFRCFEYSDTTGFVQYCAQQQFLDHQEAVSVLAMKTPYVFGLIGSTNFLLKRLNPKDSTKYNVWEELAWLRAGRRHQCLPSLALRLFGKEVAASIAYTSELVGGTNWCLGIQELRVSYSLDACETTSASGTARKVEKKSGWQTRTFDAWTPAFPMHPAVDSRPKSLSYTHPYLLAALPDNTMMVYLVTSTSESLILSDGNRLWGHTSGISSSEVNGRGKAVTTSSKGGEIRVWDLEGLARGHSQGRTSTPLIPTSDSTPNSPPLQSARSTTVIQATYDHDQLAFTKSWITFDDEQVLVLGERRNERILARYDFTR